jgi:hypothetical protein
MIENFSKFGKYYKIGIEMPRLKFPQKRRKSRLKYGRYIWRGGTYECKKHGLIGLEKKSKNEKG